MPDHLEYGTGIFGPPQRYVVGGETIRRVEEVMARYNEERRRRAAEEVAKIEEFMAAWRALGEETRNEIRRRMGWR